MAVGDLETLLKVEGWWEKMSSRPGQAAVAGGEMSCVVSYSVSWITREVWSPSWWSTLLGCPWCLQHTGCSSPVTLSLSWPANQKLLSQKHDFSHFGDLISALNNLCFILWIEGNALLWCGDKIYELRFIWSFVNNKFPGFADFCRISQIFQNLGWCFDHQETGEKCPCFL